MDKERIATLARRIKADYENAVASESRYKVEGAELARTNVREALAGERDWPRVFVGKARPILQNLLASNQWNARATKVVLDQDAALLTSMVRHLWEQDDVAAAANDLDALIDDERVADDMKAFRSIRARASVLSFFRFLADPNQYPMYRPGHVGQAMVQLGMQPLDGDDPASLLNAYDGVLDEVLAAFQEAGLPLRDRLDAQAVLWAVKRFDDVAKPTTRTADDDPPFADGQGEKPGATPANGDIAVQLPAIQAWLRSKGLHYPDALVSHYLAALLTKPFVVLSGLSGSGKTRLALDVGELFGGTVHVVPVKPDWTDTRGIMGYYNPLTQRYEVTTALRAALDAHETTDPVTLVLDEMNLAHVERYFADVLSAMEGGHPIPLHDSDEVVAQQAIPKQLAWPKNLLVVGTVNVDETTYPFSPKVLDRAFVIDINTIDAIGYLDGDTLTTPAAKPVLPSFQPSRDWRSLPVTSTDRAFVLDLHRVLTEAGRPFGYRTIAEGLAYLAHARPFRNAGLNAQDTLIASKILPRFHGRRHELEPALHGLAQWLDLDLDGEIDPSQPIGHPLTHAALVAMSRQLASEGYVASTVG